MATIWLVSLLPFLLLAALVLSIALIPITRRLRREMEEAGFSVDQPRSNVQRPDLNITPWHRQIRNLWSCLLYTSPSPRDVEESRMPSSA